MPVPLKKAPKVSVIAEINLDKTPGTLGTDLGWLALTAGSVAAPSRAIVSLLPAATCVSDPVSTVAVFATTASFF
jgi:hypothetical protein